MPTGKKLLLTVLAGASALLAPAACSSTPTEPGSTVSSRNILEQIERTPERLERGRYLVTNVLDCFTCHSQNDWKTVEVVAGTEGGGGLVPDEFFPIPVYAPNISPDPETGAGTWTDQQFVRALREGIGHDGRTLIFMPSVFFRALSDEDLASVITYIRSIPPVRHLVPRTQWPEPMKAAAKPFPPVTEPIPDPDRNDPLKYGGYLATVAACVGCHSPVDQGMNPIPGMEYSGGSPFFGPWGRVVSANLTPDASGISFYDEAVFLKTIREGKVNGVRPLNPIMPWRRYREMNEQDLKAIFAYLKTLPPVSHRVDNLEEASPCPACGGSHGLGKLNKPRPTSPTGG